MMNNYPKMTKLARKLPTFAPGSPLRDTPGIEPFDTVRLRDWIKNSHCSAGERMAARFLLMAFNGDAFGAQFNLADALRVLDREHREVISAFCLDP